MNKSKTKCFLLAAIVAAAALVPGHLDGSERVWLHVNISGSFEPGERMAGSVGGNISKAEMTLFKIDIYELLEAQAKSEGRWNMQSKLDLKKVEVVKKWTIDLDAQDVEGRLRAERWRNAEFEIENPGLGAYVLQAQSGEAAAYQALIVSETAMVVKSDARRMIAFVADKKTGAATAGATVSVLVDGEWKRFDCDENGLADVDSPGAGASPVVAEWRGNLAAANVYSFGVSPYEKHKVYIYTDRPVYRPGQKANIKGIARAADGASYSLPEADSARVVIMDPRGNKVAEAAPTLSEFGTFSIEYAIGEAAALGYYSIQVELGDATYWHHFIVEEYRKPEYEVVVTPLKDRLVAGDHVEFSIKATHYFGEPVKGSAVSYTIYGRPLGWIGIPRGRGDAELYPWYFEGAEKWGRHYGFGEEVATGGGTTNENGALDVVFSNTRSEHDMEYRLVARVTDTGRREVEGAGAASVYRAAFRMSVSVNRYMTRPGEKVFILTNSTDLYGAPVSRSIELQINYVPPKENAASVKLLSMTVETSSDAGEARTEFTPDEPGRYEIVAVGKDERGNLISERAWLYVVESGRIWNWGSSEQIGIMLDRDSYSVGDEVVAMISSELGDAHALITLEADEMLDRRVVKLENGAAYYSFKIAPEHQPNVYLSVVAIKDNAVHTTSKIVVCPPVDKFLNVKVTSDKDVYAPGERARVVVEALDNEGNPASAELSIGAVDESIYAVRPEPAQDIRWFFYDKRGSNVRMDSSLWFSGGGGGVVRDMAAPMAAPEAMLTRTAGKGMEAENDAAYAPAQIRSYFPDTAYWAAQVVTNAEGRAYAEFIMPDTLTAWRVTTRAATADTEVGEARANFVARKNLMIRLRTPRFFTQGDELNISAVINNYLDEDKEVLAVLNATGFRLLEGSEKKVVVRAGGDALVEWRAVVEAPGEAWVTAKALTDEESDAMQLTIPVLPRGARGTDSAGGETNDKTDFTLKLPGNYVPGTEELKITLASSLTAGMFSAFEYLADYPYGCVEQTMSRFLPNAVMAEALQRANKPLTGKLKELPDMAQKGYERLADMQNEDGSWGWWKGEERNAMMTAYVVFGMARAARADFAPPEGLMERGAAALKDMYEKIDDLDDRAYALFALAQAGRAESEDAKKLFASREKLTDYGKALLGVACSNLGMKEESLLIASELAKSARVVGATASWETNKDRRRWTDNAVETAAFALMAILEADPTNPVAAKAVNFINMTRRGDRWQSTRDTAAALIALTLYMEKRESARPEGFEYVVTVNDKVAAQGSISADETEGEGVSVDASRFLKPGTNRITVKRGAPGNLYYNAALKYHETADFLKPKDNGIKVERWYSWDPEGKKKLSSRTKLKAGDRIWSHVRVRPRASFDYVIVENYLPSGFEVDRDARGGFGYYYWTNREIRDDRVVSFLTRMYDREYLMSVSMRAETPGKVTAMPCVAELMYFPEVNGRSSEASFHIVE